MGVCMKIAQMSRKNFSHKDAKPQRNTQKSCNSVVGWTLFFVSTRIPDIVGHKRHVQPTMPNSPGIEKGTWQKALGTRVGL